jgi:acyl transferase domain-containing protein
LAECNRPPAWSLQKELLKESKETNLALAEYSQPCCTAVQVALVDVLRFWGVQPSAVVGHSSGEIGAAVSKVAILYALFMLMYRDSMLVVYLPLLIRSRLPTIEVSFRKASRPMEEWQQ